MAKIKAAHDERHRLAEELLSNIKSQTAILDPFVASLEKSEPDFIYRFYHQSFKVFGYKEIIRYSIKFFEGLSPTGLSMNSWHRGIVDLGLSKDFTDSTNENWLTEVEPLPAAFWHTKFFARQMKSSASSLETAPDVLPYDWAAVLYLYDLR